MPVLEQPQLAGQVPAADPSGLPALPAVVPSGAELPDLSVRPVAAPPTPAGDLVASDLAAGDLVAGDRCPATVYLARLAPSGRRVQATALARIAGLVSGGEASATTLPWGQLRYAHTHAVRAHLAAAYAPATANRMLAALRGVLREAWRLEQMTSEDFHRAVDLPAVRGERLPAGRAVTPGELTALFATCKATPGGARDAALLAVLYGTGVRRSEAVALDVADIDLEAASVRVRNGKGAKARMTYLPAGAVAAVAAWLEVRGDAAGPLFVPVRRGGHLRHGHRMSGQAVRDIVRRRAAAANVAATNCHDLRRSFVGDLLDRGADLSTTARLCGHSSPTTTARYDRRPEAAKARAANLLHIPYTPPAASSAAPGGESDTTTPAEEAA